MVKFVGGCLTGAVLLLVAQGIALFLAYQYFMGPIMESISADIPPPPFPASEPEKVEGVLRLLDLDGNPLEITIGEGKTLVVNMWATWCPPCVAEMPSLAKLAERADELGFTVLCVSEEPVQTLKAWRDNNKSAAPIYHLQEMPMKMGEEGIPETWIIGPNGHVAFKHIGMANWAHESVIEFLGSVTGNAPAQEATVVDAPVIPLEEPAPDAQNVPMEEQPQEYLETPGQET